MVLISIRRSLSYCSKFRLGARENLAGGLMLDGQAGDAGSDFGEARFVACGRARLAIVHRERSQNFAAT